MITGVLREAWALVRTQRSITVLLALISAAASATVVLTAGRSAALEDSVLATIDAQGTRTITIRAKSATPGVDESLVAALGSLDDVEAVTGVSSVREATAVLLPFGTRLPTRMAFGTLNDEPLEQPQPGPAGLQVWVPAKSALAAGLSAAAGTLRILDGEDLWITASPDLPPYLAELAPVGLIPAPRATSGEPRPVTSIYVLTTSPESVSLVTGIVNRLLGDVPRDRVTIATSQAAVDLRAALDGDLRSASRGLVLISLFAASTASALAVLGYIMLRRRDIGRRRALGASRLTVILLVEVQVLITVLLGSVAGLAVSATWMRWSAMTLPGIDFLLAVSGGVVSVTTLLAAVPVVVAARRDPVRELRVP